MGKAAIWQRLKDAYFRPALERSPLQVVAGRRIFGCELEILFLHPDGTMASCEEFFRRNLRRIPYSDSSYSIVDEEATFELVERPGQKPFFRSMFGAIWSIDASRATFEWASPPYSNFSRFADTVRRLHNILSRGAAPDTVVSRLACQPVERPRWEMWFPDLRYEGLVSSLRKPAVYTMANSAGLQQNIDLAGEQEVVQAINVFNELGCVAIALSANSPLFCGRSTGLASTARAFYRGTKVPDSEMQPYLLGLTKKADSRRVGLVPRVSSLDDYFSWLIDLNYLIHIESNGKVIPYGRSFREFIEDHEGRMNDAELLQALRIHEGCIHVDARFRSTYGGIEVRAQDQDGEVAGHALSLGLAMNLDEAFALAMSRPHKEWEEFRERALRLGPKGLPRQLLVEVIEIAEDGLRKAGKQWEKYLQSYKKRAKKRHCPAYDVLSWHKQGGITLVIENTKI